MADTRSVVAVINSSPDVIDMLRVWFERAGLIVVAAHTWDIRDGKVDVEAFLRQHRPAVIVYDVAPPYQANWRFLQHFQQMPEVKGCAFVLTTTNVARLRELVQTHEAVYEIVEKPYDLQALLDAVQVALETAGQT